MIAALARAIGYNEGTKKSAKTGSEKPK